MLAASIAVNVLRCLLFTLPYFEWKNHIKLFQESIIQWYAIVNVHKCAATGFIEDEKEV